MSVGMGASDNQEVIINHCEYLQDVYGPADAKFTNNELDLNPGLLENFPFLAQIAANYEEYEFIQLMFHFKITNRHEYSLCVCRLEITSANYCALCTVFIIIISNTKSNSSSIFK